MLVDADLVARLGRQVVGRRREVEIALAALHTGRHLLLEGPPGMGKSTLLRAVANELGVGFEFVEGNAELTPAHRREKSGRTPGRARGCRHVVAPSGPWHHRLGGRVASSHEQLGRSGLARKIVVLLSDCRATVPGDAESLARTLELCVAAPEGDSEHAIAFAAATGARVAVLSGPSSVPEVVAELLS